MTEMECHPLQPLEFSYLYRGRGSPAFEEYTGDWKFLTCDMRPNHAPVYRLYPDAAAAISAMENDPVPTLHEVIFGKQAQRLKFDLDISAVELAAIPGALIAALASDVRAMADGLPPLDPPLVVALWVKDVICRVVSSRLSATPTVDIYETTDEGPRCAWKKYSYHLVVSSCHVSCNKQAQEITREVMRGLPQRLRCFLDSNVNKSVQNFRICGSYKTPTRRKQKLIISPEGLTYDGRPSLNALITWIPPESVLIGTPPDAPTKSQGPPPAPPSVEAVLAICREAGLLNAWSYRGTAGGIYCFNRRCPSFCEICQREHTSDNTLIVFVAGRTVMWSCRKSPVQGVNIPIGTLPSTPGAAVAAAITNIDTATYQPISYIFDSSVEYSEPRLRPFQPARTLLVHAGMKMGKTKALVKFIEEYFPHARVLIVSFRQTFSANIARQFPLFTLYSSAPGVLNQDKLICQVESLHRVAVGDPYDLLVCDESEAIFEQLDSGLMKGNFNQAFAVFKWLMRTSREMIVMDAFMTDRTIAIVEHLRGLEGVSYHRNSFANMTDDVYKFTSDSVQWFAQIDESLAAGEKIAILANSLERAKTVCEYIAASHPTLAIQIYSSETRQSTKREHFADVNKYWAMFDVLIYTPTVTAGVSFEIAHYSRVFCYFTDQSCTTQTCIQMIGRIREVITREYIICIAAQSNNLPETYDEVYFWLHESRMGLAAADELDIPFEYDDHGRVKFYNTDYLTVWIHNAVMRFKSRNSFTRLLMTQLASTGATCELLRGDKPYDPIEVAARINAAKTTHKTAAATAIADAPDISREQVDQITEDIVQSVDVEPELMHAREKYWLKQEYAYTGPITPEYVEIYHPKEVRIQYRNLVAVWGQDPATALDSIRQAEIKHYKFVTGLDDFAQAVDVKRIYNWQRHRIALGWLQAMGWRDLSDPAFVGKRQLHAAVVASADMFRADHRSACTEWGLQYSAGLFVAIAETSIDFIVKFFNQILKRMYGMCIYSRDGEMFKLRRNKLFCVTAANAHLRPLIGPRPDAAINGMAELAYISDLPDDICGILEDRPTGKG